MIKKLRTAYIWEESVDISNAVRNPAMNYYHRWFLGKSWIRGFTHTARKLWTSNSDEVSLNGANESPEGIFKQTAVKYAKLLVFPNYLV